MMKDVFSRGRIYDSVIDTIGGTPLVRLPKLAARYGAKAEIVAKLEFFNPLASVKDRIGRSMIESLEAKGVLEPGGTVIEPTSGNTGLGLAFVCAAKGYKLILCMPESMSVERRKMVAILGAQLELTPKGEGMKGAIARAEQLQKEMPGAIIPQQFSNPANPLAHETLTGHEILQDTGGEFDYFVSGVGTGGTITGVGRVLKAAGHNAKLIAVEPEDSPVISGGAPGPHAIQGIGAGFVPDNLDTSLIDRVVTVSNASAFEIARATAQIEGIPVGISSGAALAAALEIASEDGMEGKRLIVLIPSFAERYLSTPLFDGLG